MSHPVVNLLFLHVIIISECFNQFPPDHEKTCFAIILYRSIFHIILVNQIILNIKTANVVLVNTSTTTFRQIFFLTRTILSSKQKPRYAQKKTKELKMNTPLSPLSTTDLTAKIRLFSARSSSNTDPTWMGNTISAPC